MMTRDTELTKYASEKLDSEPVDGSDDQQKVPLTEEDLEEERKLVRKLDLRILPIACLLYLFACKLQIPKLQAQCAHAPLAQTWTAQIWAMHGCRVFPRTC
jgi:hypothetical protein